MSLLLCFATGESLGDAAPSVAFDCAEGSVRCRSGSMLFRAPL